MAPHLAAHDLTDAERDCRDVLQAYPDLFRTAEAMRRQVFENLTARINASSCTCVRQPDGSVALARVHSLHPGTERLTRQLLVEWCADDPLARLYVSPAVHMRGLTRLLRRRPPRSGAAHFLKVMSDRTYELQWYECVCA